jgi:hypothetical protein
MAKFNEDVNHDEIVVVPRASQQHDGECHVLFCSAVCLRRRCCIELSGPFVYVAGSSCIEAFMNRFSRIT